MQARIGWDDLRFLLAAQEGGSFAAAARRLRVDQATVGRRLRALQAAAGTALLERAPGRLELTEAGRAAVRAARAMDEAAAGLSRALDAGLPEVAGVLRVTATDALAAQVLVPRLPELRARHPGLLVELRTSNRALDLGRRDADLAVRLFRPTEPALAARRAGTLAFGLYAARGYLARRGRPTEATLAEHDLLGYDRDLAAGSGALAWPDEVPGGRVAVRASSAFALLAAARAGLGVALLPCFLADPDPALARALPALRARELWVAVHGDLRRSARARAGLAFLAEVLADAGPLLRGERPGRGSPGAPGPRP